MTATTEVLVLLTVRGSRALKQCLGIRKATAWYNSHLSLSRPPVRGQSQPPLPPVVLLTDDVANRQKGEKDGLTCMSGKSHQGSSVAAHYLRLRPQSVNMWRV